MNNKLEKQKNSQNKFNLWNKLLEKEKNPSKTLHLL